MDMHELPNDVQWYRFQHNIHKYVFVQAQHLHRHTTLTQDKYMGNL